MEWISQKFRRFVFWWELRKYEGQPIVMSFQTVCDGMRTTYEVVGKITAFTSEPYPEAPK